ncbi:hypothetical protein ACLJJ6_08960 [Pediococcus siamensis]|uniref:hypothetical protein n=1 Tax=Pediococcus siamensis TaxID=381829 RepID=UPI00399F25EB
MAKTNFFDFTLNHLNAELVFIKFNQPTMFNPNHYPALKQMGKWTGNKAHTTLSLRTRNLSDYNQKTLITVLKEANLTSKDYTLETFPMGSIGLP